MNTTIKNFRIAIMIVILSSMSHLVNGQWTTANPYVYLTTSSNKVGIGTSSPGSKLTVKRTVTLGSVFQQKIINATQTLVLGANATAAEIQSQGRVPLYLNYGGNNVIMNPISGNVRIGTGSSTSAYKLDVCGTVRAKEVRVETGWCAYVFANDFKLRPLSEVESFINEKKHLPDVTAGNVIEKEGLASAISFITS